MIKEIEIVLRKLILNIYLFFSKSQKKQTKLELSQTDKILLIRLNKIGDALVTTPFLKAIKENIGCTIHVLADKKNHFIFQNNSNADRTFIFSKNTADIKSLRSKLESENYKAVFDLHDDVSTTVTLFINSVQIPNKVSFDKKTRKIYTHIVPYLDPTEHHVVERYNEIIKYLKLPLNQRDLRIDYKTNNESILYADEFFEKEFSQSKFLVGINISAGSDARFWGIERYQKLISYFSEYDVNLLLFCTPGDKTIAEKISQGKVSIFVNPDFDKFAAAISNLDFLFTPDTSVVHLASSFNIPMFGIYVKYKTDNVVWYPYNTEHDLIITEEQNFENLLFETVTRQLKLFFEQIYNGKRNS